MRFLTTSGSTLTPKIFESKRTPDGVASCNAEQTEVLRSCLEAPGPDVRVVFCLREGAVLLEVSNAGRPLELYREDVTSGIRMRRRGQPLVSAFHKA